MRKELLLLILLSGCVSARMIETGDTVQVEYVGKLVNGTVFDAGNITFTTGSGQVIQGFDEGVIGMVEGESKTLIIPPEKGYGLFKNESITAPFDVVNSSVFNSVGINADVGVIIFVYLNDGTEIRGRIWKIEDGIVWIQPYKSHELQGETLIFEVKILKIE